MKRFWQNVKKLFGVLEREIFSNTSLILFHVFVLKKTLRNGEKTR